MKTLELSAAMSGKEKEALPLQSEREPTETMGGDFIETKKRVDISGDKK